MFCVLASLQRSAFSAADTGRNGLRWRGAVSGGGERSQVERISLRWNHSLVEGSCLRWTPGGVVSGGGERSQVEGSCLRWSEGGLRWSWGGIRWNDFFLQQKANFL